MKNRKKLLISIIIFLFLIFLLLSYVVFQKINIKKNFEVSYLPFADKNKNTIFQINKIVMFSSADSKSKTSSATNFTIENLYQYTDIAIFIKSTNQEHTLENTLKSVSINNIKFDALPSIGEPSLYFKSINNFAKSDVDYNNIITDTLDFNITSEDTTDLNTPTLFNNLANPITLSYVNKNIKSDYTITDTSIPITYDGSLLKKCNIDLNSINCNLSFDINITNNLNQNFKTTVFIGIPLQDNENLITNGNIKLTKDVNYKFYRYN